MSNISCLIVEDEPLSQDVLKKFIEDTPLLHLSGICSDALEALTFLQENPVDLIFLDINMPKLSGINFVRSLEHPPMIIFTTAYAEYAVEGFELDAVDYLLKPIAFNRFLKAANKAIEHKKAWKIIEKNHGENDNSVADYLMIKSDKKIYKIDFGNLLYLQSYGDYVKIFTKDKTIIASETLKNMEQYLGDHCIRVHKSFLVAVHALKYVEGNQVKVHDRMIPIGKKYREEFLRKFKM
jgi:DNA-binding LytR/AlgR family response regulator